MADRNAQRLERLLDDPEFVARFREDPARTAREAGLDSLAAELELGEPMQTLEPRESRSSLAGVLMAAALEGLGAYDGGNHLAAPVEDAVGAGESTQGDGGWTFVRAGASFPGNHPDYGQLRGSGVAGVLWNPDDAAASAGVASTNGAGLRAGIWLVPHQNETPAAFAQRTADAIARYRPDKVVLDVEAIGKGYSGSTGWRWSDEMMDALSRLQPDPPPLAVTVEPLQDDFNYAAYTSRGAEVWPQSYLGDMTPLDPNEVVARVVANGVPANRVVPVLGPKQLDGYSGARNVYTADDIQSGIPPQSGSPPQDGSPSAGNLESPDEAGFRPALTPEQVAADRTARDAVNAAMPQPVVDPDDLEGNLDDEDGGADEVDGSNEDEPDEAGGEDDDGGTDDEESDDEGSDDAGSDNEDEEDESGDDDQDAPGEGSNGEDADDDSSDGDSSDDDSSDDDSAGNGSDSGDDSDSDNSGDSSADGGEAPDLQGVATDYPGDAAPREQIATWMGSAAQKRGLPPELPVMAALTESGMRNLSYGDADSVGFFQMRLSIWNQGAYGGYADKPERQLSWFLDHAEAIKKKRLARGLPVDDPNQYGEWIADVENPAAQYRGRYQQHLAEARELLTQDKAKRSAGDEALQVADAAGSHAGPKALAAVAEARTYLGTPYRWGGSSPATGFDCSGLVQWVYAKQGIRIPRVTHEQILAPGARAVSRQNLLPGDLVFFRNSTGYVHHVGISLGGDRFLHAPHTGDVVKISSLKDSYYAREFTGGRRFVAAVSDSSRDPDEAPPHGPSAMHSDGRRAEEKAVRIAMRALDDDASAAQDSSTAVFRALERQELGKGGPADVPHG